MPERDFCGYLAQQARLHPSMQPQDAAKLCWQAVYGPGHLLSDRAAAERYFREEFSGVTAGGGIAEPICGRFARFSLSGWKAAGLPPEWLFGLFARTASRPYGDEAELNGVLAAALDMAAAGSLPFDAAALAAAFDSARRTGFGGLHHSGLYRQCERPAYRVVGAEALRILPLLKAMAGFPQTGGPNVIAVDGRAASGKTTAASLLRAAAGAAVIRTDDFFLPADLRTAARYAEPGGNFHRERFAAEVLPHLRGSKPFSYRAFDCSVMAPGSLRQVGAAAWRVVEGSYACHPALGRYWDIAAFSDVGPQEQMRRIRLRDGGEYAGVFAERWIPLEEAYFSAYDIRAKADLIL